MAVLAPDLDGVRHFAIDEAVAMAVLREMAVRALQPLFGMNVHQMHGLAWIGADGNELPLPLPAPFFRIVGRDRKRVVSGKSGSVRVDLGGGRISKKKKKKNKIKT